MGKIPYIPLYIGDWEQDANCLSIEAEGAWLKVVFKCWKNAGVFIADLPTLARLCKVSEQKFASILLEWKTNDICNIEHRDDGAIIIICRRHIKDIEKSKKKAANGSKGGKTTQAKLKQKEKSDQAKTKQNTDNDIDTDNEVEKKNSNESQIDFSKPDVGGDEVFFPIDTPAVRDLWAKWKKHRWTSYGARYGIDGEQADLKRLERLDYNQIEQTILAAIANNWKNLYPDKNGKSTAGTGANKKQQHVASTIDYLKQHYGGTSGG